MPRHLFLLTCMLSALFLVACQKQTPPEGIGSEATLVSDKDQEGGSLETGDGFGFKELALTIEVDDEEMVAITYDVQETAQATYLSRFQQVDVDGAQAMNESRVLFQAVRIQKDMPPEQIMDEILQFYNLESFSRFYLDVLFDRDIHLVIDEKG